MKMGNLKVQCDVNSRKAFSIFYLEAGREHCFVELLQALVVKLFGSSNFLSLHHHQLFGTFLQLPGSNVMLSIRTTT